MRFPLATTISLSVLLLSAVVTSRAAQVELSSVDSSSSADNIKAVVPSEGIALTLKVLGGGQQSTDAERQKCLDVLSLVTVGTETVFTNAVSSLKLEFIFSDSKGDVVEAAWRDALTQPGSAFDLKGATTFVPLVSSVAVTLRDTNYASGAPKSARRFLDRQLESFISSTFQKQISSFNTSRLVRAETNDQALVCVGILIRDGTLNLRFNGRTFDRVQHVRVLDEKCTREVIRGLNAGFARQQIKLPEIRDQGEFALLFGVQGARLSTGGGFFSSGSANRFCAASGADIGDAPEALAEWSRALRLWYDLAKSHGSLALSASDLSQLDEVGVKTSLRPTNIWYEFKVSIAGGARQ